MTDYQLPMFSRLQPYTQWAGGRITDTDVLTLDDAARFASNHASIELTPSDFLRAAARGEILLRAICPRTVTMLPCREADTPLVMPRNSIPTLPLEACKALANVGQAEWRSYDYFEPAPALGGCIVRFVRWQLPAEELDLITTLADCRITGRDVHALADACVQRTEETTTAISETPKTGAPSLRPIPAQRFQENEILRIIAELGYTSKALPKDISGKPGAKAQIRDKLTFTVSQFNKAWERLSAAGDIRKIK